MRGGRGTSPVPWRRSIGTCSVCLPGLTHVRRGHGVAIGGSVTFIRPKQTRNLASYRPARGCRSRPLARRAGPARGATRCGPPTAAADRARCPHPFPPTTSRTGSGCPPTTSTCGPASRRCVGAPTATAVDPARRRRRAAPRRPLGVAAPVEARLTAACSTGSAPSCQPRRARPLGLAGRVPGRNALDVHVLRLRRRLSPLRLAIRTVRSRGYLLERCDGSGGVGLEARSDPMRRWPPAAP